MVTLEIQKNLSLPNGKGSAIVNSVDQMVKRKAKSEIVLCTITKESICLYCQKEGALVAKLPRLPERSKRR